MVPVSVERVQEEPLHDLAVAAGAFFERWVVVVVRVVVAVGGEGGLGRGRVRRAELRVPVVVRVHAQRARCQLDGWSEDRSHRPPQLHALGTNKNIMVRGLLSLLGTTVHIVGIICLQGIKN